MDSPKRPNIKICTTVYDIATWDGSLAKACVKSMDKRTDLPFTYVSMTVRTTIIEEGRNALIITDPNDQRIHQPLDSKYSHWLFVDHDCGFVPEQIIALLKHNKDFISGAYRPKDKTTAFVAGWCDDTGRIMEYTPAVDKGLIEVDWVGGGFVLVKREALEKMEYPYFWKSIHIYGNRALTIGDDLYFCLNARRQLITVYLDTSVVLNHEANRYNVIPNKIIVT